MAALPTAPAPPATSTTRSCNVPGPSRDGPSSVTVRQRCAVRNGIPRHAPRSKDASTGSRTTWLAGTIANSWAVPSARRKAASHIHTRWPTSAASTPMPTASTTPAPSWPGTCGGSITDAAPPAPEPRRDFQSVGFTPDRCTAILACPGPGSGTALSIRVRTSGSPVLEYTTARIRPTVIARRPDRLPRVSTLSESRPAPVGVLLRFDGVVHSSDLPVQSFARHLTDALPTDQVRAMIAGMRGFLEGKPELIPAGIDLAGAEDGYQAVELLGRAAGLTDAVIAAAYRASRADLAASAWAVDESDGLDELLAALDGRVSRVCSPSGTTPRHPRCWIQSASWSTSSHFTAAGSRAARSWPAGR